MKTTSTLGNILTRQGGVGAGFDYLRIALAIVIFLAHAASVAETRGLLTSIADLVHGLFGAAPIDRPPIPVHTAIAAGSGFIPDMGLSRSGRSRPIVLSFVPMFFALSGFLVAGSAYRVRRVVPFLALRVLRIMPALCVEVVLSAFLIGFYVTTLPNKEYFSDRMFFTYFGNILGFVQMTLPGVFFPNSGESVAVNANLWTLPGEFYCYLILSATILSGLVFKKTMFSIVFTIGSLILLVANLFYGFHARQGMLATDINVYYFCVGLMFFLWKDIIPRSWFLFVACLLLVYFTIDQPAGVYIAPIPLTYATVFIGLLNFPNVRLLRSGDYSYGIYLYGFPITQLILFAFPQFRTHYFLVMLPSLALTIIFAYLSWHLIEKHFLKLKKHFAKSSARVTAVLHPEVFSPGALGEHAIPQVEGANLPSMSRLDKQ